jgi:hypothetical protein
VPIILKSINLNFLETSGPLKTCSVIALRFNFYSLLLEADWIPESQCSRKDYVNLKFQSDPANSRLVARCLKHLRHRAPLPKVPFLYQYNRTNRCPIYFLFITINSIYMFPVLICSSSGDTVYTTIGSTPTLLAANRHNSTEYTTFVGNM